MDPNQQSPVSTRLKAEEFYRLPEDGHRYELIEGEVEVPPSPNELHQRVVFRLARFVGNYLDEHPIGQVYVAPFDVELDDGNVYQPDVLVVLAERSHIITPQRVVAGPDLVVEVLSEKTAMRDRNVKLHRYAESGVREVWLIDPERARVEVHRLRAEGGYVVAERMGREGMLRTPLLPGLEIAVARLYG